MAVVWFSDEDRERMRREREAILERHRLFWEFVEEVQPFGEASREDRMSAALLDKLERGLLDIRPWRNQPDRDA
jgi:hypothetical protein